MFELIDCEKTLLDEIAHKSSKRRDIAKTYALSLRSSERDTIDWKKVNAGVDGCLTNLGNHRPVVARWAGVDQNPSP